MEGANGAFIAGVVTAVMVPLAVSAVYNRVKNKLPGPVVTAVDWLCDIRDMVRGRMGI